MRDDKQQVSMPDLLGEAKATGRPNARPPKHSFDAKAGLKELPNTPSVCFLLSHDKQFVKTGKASNPRTRIADIRRMNSHELTVLAVIPGYTYIETWFHTHFHRHRNHYEWFRYVDDLREMVDALASGKTLESLNPILAKRVEWDVRDA